MKNILVIILFCAVFISCKREYDKDKFGPEVIIVPENFTVSGFTITPNSFINLASEDAFFSCTMPQRAEFKIILRGLLSGAEKTIAGAGESIDASNSTWTGDTDNLYMFRNGEDCSIELSFRGAKQKYYDTITIAAENIYPQTTIINTFEGITFDKNGPNTATIGNYFDTGDNSKTDIRSDNTLKTCEGLQSLNLDGVDANNSFYIGGVYFYPPTATYIFDGYSPDSLYFNAYVYSYGDNSANLIFTFSEDDNGDNVIDKVNDDEWTKEVTVDGQGWTLLSLRFKDFADANPSVGNGTFNLDKIKGFNLNFNARTAGIRARANVDYLIVSYGRPFEP